MSTPVLVHIPDIPDIHVQQLLDSAASFIAGNGADFATVASSIATIEHLLLDRLHARTAGALGDTSTQTLASCRSH